ncbi:MAG: hypothetical protein QOD73_895 [Solirubrobacteraceae bacterium]|jgi:hypothetical protein|nr:hypothetical protein [Solirubrobacteraceae bacterium]
MTPSLLNKAISFARSPQGRKLAAQAKKVAKDPATKQKIEDARQRLAKRNKPPQ